MLYLLYIFLLTSFSDKSIEIINALQKRYDSAKSIQIIFKQQVSDGFDYTTELNGEFILKRPNFYKYKTDEQLILTDMKTLWDYRYELNQVRINDYSVKNQRIKPTDFFLNYKDNYNSIYLRMEKELTVIKLFPKSSLDEESNLNLKKESITLWIDAEKNELKKIVQNKKNGNIVAYTIEKTNIDLAFPTETFLFKNTMKAEEIDLRF